MKIGLNKPEALSILGIFLIALIFAFIFYIWEESSLFGFLTEFFAAALGVLLAFTIERNWRKTREKKDCNDLLRDLRTELREIYSRLIRNEVLFSPDIWESAISSGQIRLLASNQIRELSSIYRDFKRMEHERERLRELDERIKLATANSKFRLLDDLNFQKNPILAGYTKLQKKLIKKIEDFFKENEWKLKD